MFTCKKRKKQETNLETQKMPLSCIQSLSDLRQHVEPGTVVFLDIDETIIMPKGKPFPIFSGSGEWLLRRAITYQHQERKDHDALMHAIYHWQSEFVLCEGQVTLDTIHHLQDHGVCVMGLTARYSNMEQSTIDTLGKFGIDFTRNNPMKAVQLQHGTYSRGVIFTNAVFKHEVLDDFLSQQPFENLPHHLVFCDDRAENCAGIHEKLKHPVHTKTVYHYFPVHAVPMFLIDYSAILRTALTECQVEDLKTLNAADAITAYQIHSFLRSKGATVNWGSLLKF